MSVIVNSDSNSTVTNSSGSRAMFRLAIPAWTFGRRRRPQNNKRGLHTSRDEIINLFDEELRRPVVSTLMLSPQERKEYNEALKLRRALYEAS